MITTLKTAVVTRTFEEGQGIKISVEKTVLGTIRRANGHEEEDQFLWFDDGHEEFARNLHYPLVCLTLKNIMVVERNYINVGRILHQIAEAQLRRVEQTVTSVSPVYTRRRAYDECKIVLDTVYEYSVQLSRKVKALKKAEEALHLPPNQDVVTTQLNTSDIIRLLGGRMNELFG